MFETIISYGNSVEPYRVIEKQEFHTPLAALLYGKMKCPEYPEYHYWWTNPNPRILEEELDRKQREVNHPIRARKGKKKRNLT